MIALRHFSMALVLSAPALLPYTAARRAEGASELKINNQEYETRCGEKSNPLHPCFANWWFDLENIKVTFDNPKVSLDDVLVKDNHWKDFTMRDPHESFTLLYVDTHDSKMRYGNYTAADGCYDIEVSVSNSNKAWRIWVADQIGKDKDLDTLNGKYSKTRLCTKWLGIHVKPDGHGVDSH